MNSSVPGAPSAVAVSLTPDEAIRIEAALSAAHAASTNTVYACAWRRWAVWAAARGIDALPADPAAVCAYLTERATQGVSSSTIDLACCAIGHEHRRHGLGDPISHTRVRQVRRGLRRTLGTRPRRLARPLDVSDIRRILAALDRSSARDARDAAIILLGFASALRRSELAGLRLADIEAKPAGILLHVHRSKTDPDVRGQVVGVAHGRHAFTDPIVALDAWLACRGTSPGPVFTSMRTGHRTLDPISGDAIARMLKERATAAGIPAERITGHSLRAGHATTAALAGSASTASPPRPDTGTSRC